MGNNFLKLAIRNLLKRKGYLFINVAGLSIGLVSFALIMEFVVFEKSYDTFHAKSKQIYRVGFDWGEVDYKGENSSRYATNVPGMGPYLVQDIPEIESYTRFCRVVIMNPLSVLNYRVDNKLVYSAIENEGFFADANFLKIFSFVQLSGDADPLQKPKSIVLTESFARKIFGDLPNDQMLGQLIEIGTNTSTQYQVTAIFQDPPSNSHLDFDYLISWATLNNPELDAGIWWSQFYTYVLTKEGSSQDQIEAKFKPILNKIYGEKSLIKIFLQPLNTIYLNSKLREETIAPGSKQQLTFLVIIAYAILFMAWINYMNMFLAKSMERANEVGVKKTLGAGRGGLIMQFFVESFLINLGSIIISAALLLCVQGYFEHWLDKDVSLILIERLPTVLLLILVILVGSTITGFYPAIVLSAYKPIEILGAKLKGSKKGVLFQRSLVYFQFVISFIVIASTLIVGKQITYMENHDIGLALEECLAVRSPSSSDSSYGNQVKLFKDRLLKYSFIKSVAFTSSIPGEKITTSAGMKRVLGAELEGNNVFKIEVDENFINTYSIRLVSGRNFSEKLSQEKNNVIINEAALGTLQFKSAQEALNQTVYWGHSVYEIIGVFSNYNHLFLQEAFEPILLSYNPSPTGFFTIKIQEGYDQLAVEKTKSEMNVVFPEYPFEYQHIATSYKHQYKKIQQFDSLTKYFALTSLVIAALGQFALSAYSMQNRLKEIAIRKVYGADLKDILVLLLRPYILMTLGSSIIGTCISFYIMDKWLQNFAFSIDLRLLDFIIPLLFILIIVLLTLGYNCVRTAITNPSRNLKYE